MADFADINAIPPLRPETLEKVRDPAAKAVLQEIVDAWKRLMRLAQVTRVAGESLSVNVPNHDHDAATAGHGGILTADRHDSYSRYDVTTTPTAAADAVFVAAVDYAAGDTRLQVVAESGGKMWLGNNQLIISITANGTVYGSEAASGSLTWKSTTNATKGAVNISEATNITLTASALITLDGTGVQALTTGGDFKIGGGASASILYLFEPSGGGTSKFGLQAPALAGNIVFTVPDAMPASSGMVLTCTTGGVMSWDAAAVVLAAGSAATVTLGGGATASQLRFLEPSGSGANYVGFKAPALAGDTVYDLPNAFPATSGFALTSTTAGVMSFPARIASGVDTVDDVIIDLATKGLVLKDTQGSPHYWRVSVSTLGVLTTTDLGTSKP